MPYKEPEQKRIYFQQYWKENKEKLSKANKEWKAENENKHKISRHKYLENNREKINFITRQKYNNNELVRYKKLVRAHTLQKYGPLKKGFCYHHNTNPYHTDKFDILEVGVHNYLERKLKKEVKQITW